MWEVSVTNFPIRVLILLYTPQVTITPFVEIYCNISKRREFTMFHYESTSY